MLADGEATMAEVAERLGVAKPTLYKLAGSREALVRACVETEAERLLGHLHERVRGEAAAGEVVAAVEAYAEDSPGGFRLLFERAGDDARPAVRRLETRLAELVRHEEAELLAAALLGGATAAVARARELPGSPSDRLSKITP